MAQSIPPGSAWFDMVIFDEASQMKPVDAYGALIRGAQPIVVGDEKQLPPTSFFDKSGETDEADAGDAGEAGSADMESILAVMGAAGARETMLRWHYRSRNERLIAVSNSEFYDDRLIVFPSAHPGSPADGLHLRCAADSPYERGTSRTNPSEAEHIADRVWEHAAAHPDQSLGIAAFSLAQAERIEDEIDGRRRTDPSAEEFFKAHPGEPFFVKNLENVQGDERDVILISTGYGKDRHGRLALNFGPLNKPGGERRLNMLITRAKRRMEVFANFTAADIGGEGLAPGVRALKAFLHYAEHGTLDESRETGGTAESPFEAAVAAAVERMGYTVRHQVGCAGYRVDLAVVDPQRPGRYALGIECDGATYHSGRSARERDRLRQEVLEDLGWRIHRVWSTDWFRYRRNAEKRLEEAVKTALTNAL